MNMIQTDKSIAAQNIYRTYSAGVSCGKFAGYLAGGTSAAWPHVPTQWHVAAQIVIVCLSMAENLPINEAVSDKRRMYRYAENHDVCFGTSVCQLISQNR